MNVKIYRSKEDCAKHKINTKRFYYFVEKESPKRGYNRRITVVGFSRDGVPFHLGYADVQTAAYTGDSLTAVDIICRIFPFKSYYLLRNDIKIYEI